LSFPYCSYYTRYHLAGRNGNNSYKKGVKTYNFIIKSGTCIRSIDGTVNENGARWQLR